MAQPCPAETATPSRAFYLVVYSTLLIFLVSAVTIVLALALVLLMLYGKLTDSTNTLRGLDRRMREVEESVKHTEEVVSPKGELE